MKKRFRYFLFVLFVLIVFPVFTGYTNASIAGTGNRAINGLVEPGRYSEVVTRLVLDSGETYLFTDYLLFLSALDAYTKGNYYQSLEDIDKFLSLYQSSYLSKDLRLLKIKAVYAILDEQDIRNEGCFVKNDYYYSNTLKEIEDYLKDFPSDQEAMYLYARTLERTGMEGKAWNIFKSLYVKADSYYAELEDEVSPDDLTSEEIIRMSKNLRRSLRLRESETLLLARLNKLSGSDKKPFYTSLADTYFRMKDYTKAASYYQKAGNNQKAAISYYRAGNLDLFENMLELARDKKTRETCTLFLLKGIQKRRDKEFDEALNIFRTAYRNYPCEEEALWHIAWTEYLMGNFLSASYNFRDLYSRHRNPGYLYWQARSLESLGQNTKRLYSSIEGDSFYAFLGRMRSGGITLTSGRVELRNSLKKEVASFDNGTDGLSRAKTPESVRFPDNLSLTFKRADFLNSVGLQDYAIKEIYSYRAEGDYDRLKICRYLQSLEAFNESFRCASKLKRYPGTSVLLYPAVYSDIVKKRSADYNIDPLVVFSVIREESRFNRKAISRAGALGLMQLMPFTAQRMAKSLGYETGLLTDDEIMKPDLNITLGSYYLGQLISEFGSVPMAVAAYNAGESAVRRWLEANQYNEVDEFIEDIPYKETRLYVKKVLRSYFKYLDIYGQQK
ncbi:Soluble lytic murein transglycosylase precursor [hydrothermal vent metagenome]|uniref:Soluble lytic murein transglycosylase n=1 Tax=hydrothermal vent metagenome TaxID=652676 RepID=A0A3B1CXY4_9ZZZZ